MYKIVKATAAPFNMGIITKFYNKNILSLYFESKLLIAKNIQEAKLFVFYVNNGILIYPKKTLLFIRKR